MSTPHPEDPEALPGRLPRPGRPASAPAPLPTVLVVDDDPAQVALLRAMLAQDGYRIEGAGDLASAMEAVALRAPDVVLLDLRLGAADGFAVLEQMQDDAWMRRIPVVVVTASDDRQLRLRALNLGAADFLSKPVDRQELRARVRSLVRAKRHADDSEQAESVILALARTAETRDPYLRDHCERLVHLVHALGQELDLDAGQLRTLRRGAYLHDIGKVAMPDAVLLKRERLDPAERALVRTHPVVGDEILRALRTLDPVRDLVRHHHEHLDGSGYPDGLAGDQLCPAIRILSVADVFDTLTCARAYRPALTPADALGVLRNEADGGWWDPTVVAALARVVRRRGAAG